MAEESKLTAKQAAERLNASHSAITRLCRNGTFPNAEKVKTPHDTFYWLIPESDLKNVKIKMGRPKKEL